MIDFDSFNQMATQLNATLSLPARVSTSQTEGLSYRIYQSQKVAEDIVIVYHGGGAHMDAGYDLLARQLCVDDRFAVCLVDIRGHGCSVGERGDVTSTDLIWRDVDTLLAAMRSHFPQSRIHLLGHSSGGGMLVNYFTRHHPQQPADSLILLAPELGPFMPGSCRNATSAPFASVRQWPFILNALSGGRLSGHYPAVRLHFPASIRASQPGFVDRYSVNMANALTPRHPAKQLAALPLCTTLLVAADDELFSAPAMVAFAEQHGNRQMRVRVIKHSSHLGCLLHAAEDITRHLDALRR